MEDILLLVPLYVEDCLLLEAPDLAAVGLARLAGSCRSSTLLLGLKFRLEGLLARVATRGRCVDWRVALTGLGNRDSWHVSQLCWGLSARWMNKGAALAVVMTSQQGLPVDGGMLHASVHGLPDRQPAQRQLLRECTVAGTGWMALG